MEIILFAIFIGLIAFFIYKMCSCEHDYKVIDQGNLTSTDGPEFGKEFKYGVYYICKCRDCGNIKKTIIKI